MFGRTQGKSVELNGTRYVFPDRPRVGTAARGSGRARRGRVERQEHELLDWREILEEMHGPERADQMTYDAVRHYWNVGVSDGRGGFIKLSFSEGVAGRRSSLGQVRAFVRAVDQARTQARAAKAEAGGTFGGGAPPRGQEKFKDEHQLGGVTGLSPAPEQHRAPPAPTAGCIDESERHWALGTGH